MLEQTPSVRDIFNKIFLYRYESREYLEQSREAALSRSLRDSLQSAGLLHQITCTLTLAISIAGRRMSSQLI